MDKTIDHRLAWLAGIIDGEGWIGIRIQRHTRHGVKYPSSDFYLAVSNTNAALLAEMASITDALGAGRSKTVYTYAKHGERWKPQGRISYNAKASIRIVLEAVLPYLVAKRPQAELMLRALDHRKDSRKGWNGVPVSRDTELHRMVEEITSMNRRGTAPVED